MKKFYRNDEIERIAEKRILDLEKALGNPLSLPVPIDFFGEQVLGLNILWEEIEELPGEIIFGGIIPKERLILLNESRQEFFSKKPGLERSTKAHEMGHWDLFVDKTLLDHPVLFEDSGNSFCLRSCSLGNATILKINSCPEGLELFRAIKARADEPDEERSVNRYAAAISMPKALVHEEVKKIDRTKWPSLYRLAEKFDVTISALVVRLKQLDLLYVGDDKSLFESYAHATGQQGFGF